MTLLVLNSQMTFIVKYSILIECYIEGVKVANIISPLLVAIMKSVKTLAKSALFTS